jgi:polyphenol oxidase
MSECHFLESSPALSAAGFRHGFSARYAGEAELDFALLRPGRHQAERQLADHFAFAPAQLYQVTQVHGTHVVRAEGDRAALEKVEADGVFAARGSAVAAAIRVADCVPILVGDSRTGDAWALHAGWRGIAQKIVAVALEALRGDAATSLHIAIGPSIGPCCFEVDAEVAAQIAAASTEGVVRKREQGKAWVDLRAAARFQLEALGVLPSNVAIVGGCSVCDPKKYHSYRRDGVPSGRMIGIIFPL